VSVLRALRARRSEAGFTLVEMVVVIVIMGIVIAPLTIAINESLNLVPESGAQSQTATDADRFQTTLAGDIASATQVNVDKTVGNNGVNVGTILAFNAPGTLTWTKASAAAQTIPCVTSGAVTTEILSTLTFDSSDPWAQNHNYLGPIWTFEYWKLVFTQLGSVTRVDVHRFENIWNWPLGSVPPATSAADQGVFLTGYCKSGDTVSTTSAAPPDNNATQDHETANVQISLRPRPLDKPLTYVVNGTVRANDQ